MNGTISRLRPGVWEVAAVGGMRVPARIFASDRLLESMRGDASIRQACNVAHLPGIVTSSLAMPDAHEGYGFPIGGVAAFDVSDGVVSPGGVGYDINCGVRLVRSEIRVSDLGDGVGRLVRKLQSAVPAGVGSEGAISTLDGPELTRVLTRGASWAVENGYGLPEDLDRTESGGTLEGASAGAVSTRARERGAPQLGTLGSGNHFVELQEVDRIYDPRTAEAFGLFPGTLSVMIHTGSRGLGYQVCADTLSAMHKAVRHHGIELPDPQLVAVPVASTDGQRYLAAMRAAANYAWANRQVIMALALEALLQELGGDRRAHGLRLVYDVAHNIAKVEEHLVDGRPRRVVVHRKGATRAFPAGCPDLPEAYRETGHPVLIPGDMGRGSFVCVGTATAMAETFGSAAHGAGRALSRTAARRVSGSRDIAAELARQGIVVAAHSRRTLAEEMPEAYKDASEVVDALVLAGIARPVVRLRPIGVIKG